MGLHPKGDDVQTLNPQRVTRRTGAAVALVVGGSLLMTACPVDVPADPGTTTTTTTSTTTTTAPPLPVCDVPDAPVLTRVQQQ